MSENAMPHVPDPNGPPVLSHASKSSLKRTAVLTLKGTLSAGVSVAAILVVGAVLVTPTSGAMRSHRITWEQRQKQICEATAAEAAADGSPRQDRLSDRSHVPESSTTP